MTLIHKRKNENQRKTTSGLSRMLNHVEEERIEIRHWLKNPYKRKKKFKFAPSHCTVIIYMKLSNNSQSFCDNSDKSGKEYSQQKKDARKGHCKLMIKAHLVIHGIKMASINSCSIKIRKKKTFIN